MARSFAGVTDVLRQNQPVVSAMPMTFAGWFWVNNLTARHILISETLSSDNGTTTLTRFALEAAGDAGGDPIRVVMQNSNSTAAVATSASAYPSGVWFHAAGVFGSTVLRTAYLNGVPGTPNTTSRTAPASLDRTGIGLCIWQTPLGPLNGKAAECAIWDVVLPDEVIRLLAYGYSPWSIREYRQYLAAYWPIQGVGSVVRDLQFRNDLTIVGTTPTAHPYVVAPSRERRIWTPFALLGGAVLTGQATLQGVGLWTAQGRGLLSGLATLQGVGLQTADGRKMLFGGGILQGVGVQSADGRRMVSGGATLQGVGLLTADARKVLYGALVTQGVGLLTADGLVVSTTAGATGNLIGVGVLTASGQVIRVGQATLQGVGVLAGGGLRGQYGQATLQGVGLLTADGVLAGTVPYIRLPLDAILANDGLANALLANDGLYVVTVENEGKTSVTLN